VFDRLDVCILKNKEGGVGMCLKLYERAISSGQIYRINYIPPLSFLHVHVNSVKHTGLLRFIHRSDIFVHNAVCACWCHGSNPEVVIHADTIVRKCSYGRIQSTGSARTLAPPDGYNPPVSACRRAT